MLSPFNDHDQPAFAATLVSILERYRAHAVERYNAVRALTAITLALAPEGFLEQGEEAQLDGWFGRRLDAFREGEDAILKEVIALVSAAAEDNRDEMTRLMK